MGINLSKSITMKKTKTSARPCTGEIEMRIPASYELHAQFSRLAASHGLNIAPAYCMLMSWAINQATLFPELRGKDWDEVTERMHLDDDGGAA